MAQIYSFWRQVILDFSGGGVCNNSLHLQMLFSNILGQTHIKNHLLKSIENGKIPHAQLFVGKTGSGLLPMALAYAQAILSSNHAVGSKGYDQLKRVYKDDIVERISFKDSKTINYLDAEKVGKMIIENFEKEEFDVCTIFYNKFKNVITQIPQEQQIIPLKTSEAEENSSEDNYEFEPDEDEILSNLLPKNISTQIFKAMLENSASEQGSRMSAMDNATRNAGEMVDKLTIEYNRSRQAAITKELIEIISGAESL